MGDLTSQPPLFLWTIQLKARKVSQPKTVIKTMIPLPSPITTCS